MERARTVRVAAAAAIVATATTAAVTAPQLASASPHRVTDATAKAPSAAGKRESVIVMLKDQLRSQPANRKHLTARRSAAHAAQARVLRKITGPAATHLINYTLGNAFSATITTGQAAQLAANPAVASVVLNRKVSIAPTTANAAAAAGVSAKAAPSGQTPPSTVSPGACTGTKKHPQLEPEALQTMNARSDDPNAKTAAALGIDGSGVKVAFIADGINPDNAGFRRKNGKSSIVDYKDFYGDGPNAPTSGAEAFGDASAISAQGNVTYDVADFANPNVVKYPTGHCYIRIVGVAPGADVVALKAGSELLPNSAILQSIDYAVATAHVNIISESFGGNIYPDSSSRNAIQTFNDQAVAAGVTVTESTGDAGITSTIGSDAEDPKVISTGASTDSRLYEQTNYALATEFGNGKWLDDNISALSSAGLTQEGRTIDVSAPGEADWAVCDASGRFSGCTSYRNPAHPYVGIEAFGGTSQSAPMTAGVAALVIQAYAKAHAGTDPTPAVVKQIITSTAHDLGLPGDEQGSGRVDARAAVEAALTWPGATSAAPAGTASNVALSTNQLTLTGKTGTNLTGHVTVTNVGTKTQTISTATRKYATLSLNQQFAGFNKNTLPTLPYPTTAAPWAYKVMHFTVPAGADELASSVRWLSGAAYNGPGSVVRLSIFTPDGTYAGNTRPQGGANPSNYGLITIRKPAAGTWTAVLYSPDYPGSVPGGYKGPIALTTQTYRAVPVGTVGPATATLAPGASTDVSVTVPVPSVGGDTVDTVSIGSSDGHQVAVPVIVRALVPTSSGSGAFGGTITGGNGRAYAPAQTFSYSFDVPKGKNDLDVGVKLADEPGDLLEGILIDPNGEVQSVNSNRTSSQGLGMQNTVASPVAGRWRYVIVVINPVTGVELTEPFTGTVAFDQVKVVAPALPTTLKSGKAATVRIKVHNTGVAPMLVQTDARLNGQKSIQLAPQFAGSTFSLPLNVEELADVPGYLVPPDTTALSMTATSTVPAQVELQNPTGGIDVFGDLQSAQAGSTVSTANVSETKGTVGLGFWGTYVQEIGPFGDGGAPAGSTTIATTATTKPFDPAVTSSTGDPYLPSVDPTNDGGTPLVIAPGATASLTVTITPTGAPGSTVNGVLHLVTGPIGVANSFNTTGEVLATLPYHYTIS